MVYGSESVDGSHAVNDLEVLNEVLAAFRKLESASQERMLKTVATFLGLAYGEHSAPSPAPVNYGTPTRNQESLFSEDRSISPKQFMFEKQPKTDIEKVACLGYYLTHYRGTEHFKTLDISTLNTDAAQVKFANPAMAVDNATKRGFLAPASKGSKQLSALGEQYVLALPDRERARNIMEHARPKRRARKSNQQRTHIDE